LISAFVIEVTKICAPACSPVVIHPGMLETHPFRLRLLGVMFQLRLGTSQPATCDSSNVHV
jgi:hypothetical protein